MPTALQDIQPNLDEILVKIRKAKDASGFTNMCVVVRDAKKVKGD